MTQEDEKIGAFHQKTAFKGVKGEKTGQIPGKWSSDAGRLQTILNGARNVIEKEKVVHFVQKDDKKQKNGYFDEK